MSHPARSVQRSRRLAQGEEITPNESEVRSLLEEDDPGPLIRPVGQFGPEIKCPVCEVSRPFMQFTQLKISRRYARYVLSVYRCPTPECRHVFALNPNPEEEREQLAPQERERQDGEAEHGDGGSEGQVTAAAPVLQSEI